MIARIALKLEPDRASLNSAMRACLFRVHIVIGHGKAPPLVFRICLIQSTKRWSYFRLKFGSGNGGSWNWKASLAKTKNGMAHRFHDSVYL